MPNLTIKELNEKVETLTKKVNKLLNKSLEVDVCAEPLDAISKVGVYKTYHFDNGKDYDIALADDNGTLIFKEAVFRAPFDDKADWRDYTNDWNKCTLKPFIEKWWDKNAPVELKDHYNPTILALEEILPDCELPDWLKGQNKQLAIFKNIKERVKNLKGEEHLCWYWTRTATRGDAYIEYIVYSDGSIHNYNASGAYAVVLACVPK